MNIKQANDMGKEKKYSFNELQSIKQELQQFFGDTKYNRNLVYNMRRNLDKIESEQKAIRSLLKEDAEGFDDFQDTRFKKALEAGGEQKQGPNGMSFINDENLDTELFEELMEAVEAEYQNVLDSQKEINEENQATLNEELAKVEWRKVPLEYFPEEISFKEMPTSVVKYMILEDD